MRAILFIILLINTQLCFAQTAKLTLIIENISIAKGNLEIGIYNDAKSFPKEDKEYKALKHSVTSEKEMLTLVLPVGEYAIAVFHDKNANRKCDRNLLRMPTEAYGFSNNVKPHFSAPDFKDAKFKLDKDKTIKIKLIH